jgi:hypothetical protein
MATMTFSTRIYQHPLLSFCVRRPEAVTAEWMQNLSPIGDRRVASGELVELLAHVKESREPLDKQTGVCFDIMKKDFEMSKASADRVISLRSPGAQPLEGSATSEERTVAFRRLVPGQTFGDVVQAFKAEHISDFQDFVLIVQEHDQFSYKVLTWWFAVQDSTEPSELYHTVHVAGIGEARSNTYLTVTDPAVEPMALTLPSEPDPDRGNMVIGISFTDERGAIGQFYVRAFGTTAAGLPISFDIHEQNNGEFRQEDVPPGEYSVVLVRQLEAIKKPGEPTEGSSIGAGHVTGWVTDSMGTPLPGRTVKLYQVADGQLQSRETTDAQGSFMFRDVPAGDYRLLVDGYEITIAPTPAGIGQMQGVLTDSAGMPLAGETVRLLQSGTGTLLGSTVTAASGAFSFQNVPAGGCHLSVDNYDITTSYTSAGMGQVQGILTDDAGIPLAGETVKLLQSSGTLLAARVTGSSGRFDFQAVPVGKYRIAVAGRKIAMALRTEVDEFISLVRDIEKLNPNLTGEDVLNGLRRIAGYDTEYFRQIYGGLPSAKSLNLGSIPLWRLKRMTSHGVSKEVETGIATDRFGYDVAMGHVLTGISGGQHRIKDVDLTPWYALLFGIVGWLAGEEMDNLYAVTISGDLGQSAYMVNEEHYSPPYVGPGTEATYAELIGDIDGVLIGKNLIALSNGRSLFDKPGPTGIRLSEVLARYYDSSGGNSAASGVSAANRFQEFSKEDMDYLEDETKNFAVNYTYYKKGKAEGLFSWTGGEAEEAVEEFREWLAKMKAEEIRKRAT